MNRAAAGAFALGLLLPGSAAAQGAEEAVVVALEPDSVLVGVEFTLGVTVRVAETERVLFPPWLTLGDFVEQRAPLEVDDGRPGGQQRAYYRLVAWKAGAQEIVPFEVGIEGSDGETRTQPVRAPSIEVLTVLPADTEDLELRDARPFLRLTGLPWWLLLLLLLALLALLWWLWRRWRAGVDAASAGPAHPAVTALERLATLRAAWIAGSMSEDELFDKLESTFRDYVAETRGWPPGWTLRTLPNGDRQLAHALRRSALVRFARVWETRDGGIRAISAGEAWIQEEWPPAAEEEELAA